MAADLVAPLAYPPALPFAAPVISEYPQFNAIPVPQGHSAARAFEGVIQPFIDDDTSREFMRRVDANLPFDLDGGTIICHPLHKTPGHLGTRLVDMQMRFHVIVLEFNGTEHPRAYSRYPEISQAAHPNHPHLRLDHPLCVGSRVLNRLCVYSGAVFKYSDNVPRIVQFLDQLSAYLGRHAIWRRTRVERSPTDGSVIRIPELDEVIIEVNPRTQMDPNFSKHPKRIPIWSGHWPGQSAPAGARNHLRTIQPMQECWCCSGKLYRECHLLEERRTIRNRAA